MTTSASATMVTRPVWRSFAKTEQLQAAKHVTAGGIAVFATQRSRVVLCPCCDDGVLDEIVGWALIELDAEQIKTKKKAPFTGMLEVTVEQTYWPAVDSWCERDRHLNTPTETLSLDCLTCAACCRTALVILSPEDLLRWKKHGRSDLAKAPATVRHQGQRVIRSKPDGACPHLNGAACSIYDIRPDNCRAFPAGCNACLKARASLNVG